MDCGGSDPSLSNSSSSSAILTSLPVPRTKHHLSPHHDTRTHQEATENLLPAFNQLLSEKENMLQPGRSLVPPRLLSPRIIGCNTTSEPIHVIIGGESEESAEGYAIPPLGEDFLLGNQIRMVPYERGHDESLQSGPLETPRRPQQFQHPFKRRSAEFSPVGGPVSPALPAPTHPRQAELSGWSRGESGRDTASGNAAGHRRSSSYGNSPQLWTGVTQQQSMPCISNLPGQAHSPRRYGE